MQLVFRLASRPGAALPNWDRWFCLTGSVTVCWEQGWAVNMPPKLADGVNNLEQEKKQSITQTDEKALSYYKPKIQEVRSYVGREEPRFVLLQTLMCIHVLWESC